MHTLVKRLVCKSPRVPTTQSSNQCPVTPHLQPTSLALPTLPQGPWPTEGGRQRGNLTLDPRRKHMLA